MNRVQKLLANTDGDLPFKCYVNPSHLIDILHDIIGKQFFLESEIKDYVIQWIKFDKFLNQFESEKERSKLKDYDLSWLNNTIKLYGSVCDLKEKKQSVKKSSKICYRKVKRKDICEHNMSQKNRRNTSAYHKMSEKKSKQLFKHKTSQKNSEQFKRHRISQKKVNNYVNTKLK